MNEITSRYREPQRSNSFLGKRLNGISRWGLSAMLVCTALGFRPALAHAEETPNQQFTTGLVESVNNIRTTYTGFQEYGVAEDGRDAEQRYENYLKDLSESWRITGVCAPGGSLNFPRTAGDYVGKQVGRYLGEALACPNQTRSYLIGPQGNLEAIPSRKPWVNSGDVTEAWLRAPTVATTIYANPEATTIVCAVYDFATPVNPDNRTVGCAVFGK